MNTIIGHKAICEILSVLSRKEISGHGYFFTGPAHVGKRTLVEWFIKTLQPSEVLRIEQNDDEKKLISAETIKDTLAALHQSTFDGGLRVVVILDAERLTREAGNALLKELEEPFARTVWIITAKHKDAVLRTIASRCIHIPVPLVGDAIIAAYAKERQCSDSGAVIDFSAGRPGMAVMLCDDHAMLDSMKNEYQVFQQCSTQALVEQYASLSAMNAGILLERLEVYLSLCARKQSMSDFYQSMIGRLRLLYASPVLMQSKSIIDHILIS